MSSKVVSLKPSTDLVTAASDDTTDSQRDLPMKGHYGWVIVVCLVGINACTWGINTTYGVYISYLLENNQFHATQLDYAWVGGLSAAVSTSTGPLANFLTTRYGFKMPMILGSVLVGLGQCMAGKCKSFAPYLICQGVVFGLGVGLLIVPSQPILSHWFNEHLALAQGISQAGSGAGGIIFANTTTLILQRLGIKWTLVIHGCISTAVLLPAVLFMRGRHKEVKSKSNPLQLEFVWHKGFRFVILWACFTSMAYYISVYTLASYATDALNLSQNQAGAIQSLLAGGQIIGRPTMGFLLDKGGRINMVILCYIVCGVCTLAMWMQAKSFGVLAAYAFISGALGGTVNSASTPIAVSVVGVIDLGSALSIYWLMLAVPSLLSQPLAILLVNYSRTALRRTGAASYDISIGFCGGLIFAGVLALVGAKRYVQGDWELFRKT